MPNFSVEKPGETLVPWSIERSFGVKVGELDPTKANRYGSEITIGVPGGVELLGRRPLRLKTPVHWEIFRDTLVEADRMRTLNNVSITVDADNILFIRAYETRLSYWLKLFFQAQHRVIVTPNVEGARFLYNGMLREEPLKLPFHDRQIMKFEFTNFTHAGITRPTGEGVA